MSIFNTENYEQFNEILHKIKKNIWQSNYKFYQKKHKLIDFDMRKRLSQNNFISK